MAFHNVSVPFGNLLSLTLASLSYGIYFVLFLIAMYLSLGGGRAWGGTGTVTGSESGLGRRRRRLGSAASVRIPIVLASLALFITATGCWILTVYRNFRGWIFFDDGKRPAAFFDDPGNVSAVVQNAFVALSIVFGDCIIVYRLWLVWRRFSVLILPVCSILGLFISSAIVGYQTSKNDPIAHVTALTPFVAFNIITNVYCTACIAYKILAVTRIAKAVCVVRYSRPSAGERLTHLVVVFVESAAGYTIIVILYMILHQLNHNLQYAVLNIVPNALGAANALITARVALGRSVDAMESASAEATAVSGEVSIQFAQINLNTGTDTQTDPEASRVGRGGESQMAGDEADEIKSAEPDDDSDGHKLFGPLSPLTPSPQSSPPNVNASRRPVQARAPTQRRPVPTCGHFLRRESIVLSEEASNYRGNTPILDRAARGIVRIMAHNAKKCWSEKDIAAIFRVSHSTIQRALLNSQGDVVEDDYKEAGDPDFVTHFPPLARRVVVVAPPLQPVGDSEVIDVDALDSPPTIAIAFDGDVIPTTGRNRAAKDQYYNNLKKLSQSGSLPPIPPSPFATPRKRRSHTDVDPEFHPDARNLSPSPPPAKRSRPRSDTTRTRSPSRRSSAMSSWASSSSNPRIHRVKTPAPIPSSPFAPLDNTFKADQRVFFPPTSSSSPKVQTVFPSRASQIIQTLPIPIAGPSRSTAAPSTTTHHQLNAQSAARREIIAPIQKPISLPVSQRTPSKPAPLPVPPIRVPPIQGRPVALSQPEHLPPAASARLSDFLLNNCPDSFRAGDELTTELCVRMLENAGVTTERLEALAHWHDREWQMLRQLLVGTTGDGRGFKMSPVVYLEFKEAVRELKGPKEMSLKFPVNPTSKDPAVTLAGVLKNVMGLELSQYTDLCAAQGITLAFIAHPPQDAEKLRTRLQYSLLEGMDESLSVLDGRKGMKALEVLALELAINRMRLG
uniref:Uncharacterized protein n=1 Tax=Mycena chlorophos TaxID=658473 RepID=A0ABQ0LF82_MYCCL|nr:predicted protein [Mycena chlorophos]